MVSLAALAAMMPAILLPHMALFRRDLRYWVVLVLALTMSALVAADHLSAGWPRGVTPALWLTAATTLAVFLPVAAVTGAAWRLSVLLLPYVAAIGLLATLVDDPGAALARGGAWTGVHIAVSLVTYGLLTVAAAAGLAREYGPKGVHVGHVIIDGGVEGAIRRKRLPKDQDSAGENELLSPAAIAEAYWQLHLQHPSAWSFEIDLRPFNEVF